MQACSTVISRTVLIVSLPFAQGPSGEKGLSGEAVARAIARGLVDGGLPQPDQCPIDPSSPLEELDFDARMRRSRAVVLAQRFLEERTLRGSVTFEIATRARQGGVPAYAVAGESSLTAFDARVMDLQRIFEAPSTRALAGAGRKLAAII
jgi:hypothetical protein